MKSGEKGGEEGVLFRVLPRGIRNGTILTSAIPSGRGAAAAAASIEGGQSLAKTLVVDGYQGPELGPAKRSVTTVEGLQDAFLQGRLPSRVVGDDFQMWRFFCEVQMHRFRGRCRAMLDGQLEFTAGTLKIVQHIGPGEDVAGSSQTLARPARIDLFPGMVDQGNRGLTIKSPLIYLVLVYK